MHNICMSMFFLRKETTILTNKYKIVKKRFNVKRLKIVKKIT